MLWFGTSSTQAPRGRASAHFLVPPWTQTIGGMNRLTIGTALLGLLFSSCVYVPVARGPGYSRSSVVATPVCHPSQYWDGAMCRHKGQGHGARKHDGDHDDDHGKHGRGHGRGHDHDD